MADINHLATWLKKHLSLTPGRDPIDRITVRHARAGGTTGLVDECPAEPGLSEEDLAQLASDLVASAQHDASQLKGEQTYAIVLCRGTELGARYALTIRSEAHDDGLDPSEPATPTGLLGMLMKHCEQKDKFAQSAYNASMAAMGSMIGMQQAKIEFFEQRDTELLKLREQLAKEHESATHARTEQAIALARVESEELAKQKFVDVGLEVARTLAPQLQPIVARFLEQLGQGGNGT